jgi:hypothetical protein
MTLQWLDKRTKEWGCCGLVWQLMMSRLYPERYGWSPVCPICKSVFLMVRYRGRRKCGVVAKANSQKCDKGDIT